jgi:hypothetical protein
MRIRADFERGRQVRRESNFAPYAIDEGVVEAEELAETPGRPVRRALGFLLRRHLDHLRAQFGLFHTVLAAVIRPSGSIFLDARKPLFYEAIASTPNRVDVNPEFLRDLVVRHAVRRHQHDPGPFQ